MKATFGAINTTFSGYTRIGSSYQSLAAVCSPHARSTSPRSIFAEVCADVQVTRVEMDGEDDHVHLPISIVRQYIEQQKTPD